MRPVFTDGFVKKAAPSISAAQPRSISRSGTTVSLLETSAPPGAQNWRRLILAACLRATHRQAEPRGILAVLPVKFLLGWVAVFLFRLIPFRPPNFEPMLATVMPFSKRYGPFGSFAFGFFGIVLYDAVTSGWGIWTAVTALAYGALGIGAHLYFKRKEPTAWNFVKFGVLGTLLYDIVTGLTIGPLFNGQSFALALAGQIPFTMMHLLGAVVFGALLSPALYRWVVENRSFEVSFLRERLIALTK